MSMTPFVTIGIIAVVVLVLVRQHHCLSAAHRPHPDASGGAQLWQWQGRRDGAPQGIVASDRSLTLIRPCHSLLGHDLTGGTRGVLESTQQMLEEQRLGVGLLCVAASGVPGPAASILLVPGDRVIAHCATGIA